MSFGAFSTICASAVTNSKKEFWPGNSQSLIKGLMARTSPILPKASTAAQNNPSDPG